MTPSFTPENDFFSIFITSPSSLCVIAGDISDDEVDAFDDDDVAVATIFSRHASVALAAAHNEDGLQVAIDARKLIGQAQGILMERYDIDADRAFTFMRRQSQDRNEKLRDIAQWIIDHRGDADARPGR